jgi:hypothetical protein
MNGGPFTGIALHLARATNALCSIAHDSKSHTVALRLFVKPLTVVLYGQQHVAIAECELD